MPYAFTEQGISMLSAILRSDVAINVSIDDYAELSPDEKTELCRLYPRIGEGEGWFGKEAAYNCMKHYKKAL